MAGTSNNSGELELHYCQGTQAKTSLLLVQYHFYHYY